MPTESNTSPAPERIQPDPKAFWDACDYAGVAAKSVCSGLEKLAHTINELLAYVCKWGIGIALLAIGLIVHSHGDPSAFKELAFLYCGGLLTAQLGEAYFDEREFPSAVTIPLLISVGLYAAPI